LEVQEPFFKKVLGRRRPRGARSLYKKVKELKRDNKNWMGRVKVFKFSFSCPSTHWKDTGRKHPWDASGL
jgi:hypothetical protein